MPNTKKIPLREDIPAESQWDLTPLFADDAAWEAQFADVSAQLDGYAIFRGRLLESPEGLAKALEFHMQISRALDNLYTYAHLKSDEDKSNSHYVGMQDRAMGLFTRVSEASSFIDPEIQALDEVRKAEFLSSPALQTFGFFLEKILRAKPHTHGEDIEKILAMSTEVARAPSQIFSQLDNADLTFGVIEDEKGERLELSHGNFISFLMKPQREIRRQAFEQYYQTYQAHRHSIAAALAHSVKKDVFYARVRNHASCRSAALFFDNVPESVYDNLVETVKTHTAPLFGYLGLRRQALGVEHLHFYDTYVPLVSAVDFRLNYDQAVEIAMAALTPLGDEYTAVLKKGLAGGWVDRYENKGKRSGAYSSGSYDSPPYILLNFENDNINSLYTLVHEAGHSMHSYLSKKHQPYVDHQYTIFAAEVASTFNEVLLSRYLLDKYKTDEKMVAYILNREIDNIRGTFFRQTMFAEFEASIHNDAEAQKPLTIDSLRATYHRLLETYFGNALVIDPQLDLECLRIPHFYSAFYVYKYATGLAAAIALARRVLDGGTAERDAYLNFLKSGGSMFPLDALKKAGADMASPEPILETVAHFKALVDRFGVQLSPMLHKKD
ncbi:oligoendopeptidase F [Desulfosarcina ovata]|uniref:Oligopeptidase F n=1 Tax=Desulfosarcina ovata subsp. ovata TaxID=2752305 RepID=A0A5K8A934_9BACT|nr:oligoendopeptidase F [Desulfosarcina ovata]BBO88938.1 peptidase [Desulfosarcina ovata subsp. ovata]